MTGQLPPAAVERRHGASEIRSKGRRLEGYAAVFNSEARIGQFVETIAAGAFSGSLAGDVLALLDHDEARLLGRTRSGTLRLSEDSRGLAFSIDLPETQAGRDVLALAERGDLGGMSFGFTVPEGGEQWEGRKRTLRSISLKEISVVSSWPAYPDTELALRAAHDARSGLSDRQRRLIIAELSSCD